MEDFFWRNFFGGFFGRNYLVGINKELMFLSRFWNNFVSMEGRRRKEDFRSLEVRRKLIALKKIDLTTKFRSDLCNVRSSFGPLAHFSDNNLNER